MKTGHLIESIMHYKHIGHGEMANKIGISEPSMSTLIAGRRNITPTLAKKIGDVLVNWNNTIYLFKGIEEEVVKFYCYYNTNCERFETPFDNNSHLGLTEPQFEHHPATKEQRDLLFQKMHEAGYEWDAKKKELKKIVDEEQIKKNLQDNNFRRMFEQKYTEWSEEDKRMYRKLHNLIYSTPYCDSRKELIDWLKSLKECIQP